MINKVFKEYTEKINNINSNYEKIIAKDKEKLNNKRKILNIAAVIIVVLFVGAMSTQIYAKIKWNIEFRKYEKTVESPDDAIILAKESGFADEIDSDYIVKDGVGIKVTSLLVTDDCLNTTVNFKFSEEKEVNSDTFGFTYAIYDENKNVYQISSRMHFVNPEDYNFAPSILKELGVKYDKNNIYEKVLSDSSSIETIETTDDRTIVKDINLRADESFPKSKKIYIKIFDLGYHMMDTSGIVGQVDLNEVDVEDFTITDEEWLFELDVSEKMYERETIELELKDEIPGIEIQKCTLTETGMVLVFKAEEYIDFICKGKDMEGNFSETAIKMLNITDKDGNIYQDLGGGTTEDGGYKITLDVAKKDLEKGLFINFVSGGEEYISEFIEK